MIQYTLSGKVQSISTDSNGKSTVVLDSSATGGLPRQGTDGPLDNYFYAPGNMTDSQLNEFKKAQAGALGVTVEFDGARTIKSVRIRVDPVDQLTPKEQAKVKELEAKYTRAEILARLKSCLQTAVEIELATLPIYLYAYYSIKRQPSTTTVPLNLFANKAGGVIMSVSVEEMLHMTLAANILFALGGVPKMYGKSPNFQSEAGGTNLPHHKPLGPDGKPVAIPLAGLSYDTLWGFLEIEYPQSTAEALVDDNWSTIGEFYSYIRCLISTQQVQDSDFTAGAQEKQIPDAYYGQNNIDTVYPGSTYTPSAVPSEPDSAASVAQYPNSSDSHAGLKELVTVNDKLSALQAISTICDQGEGYGVPSQESPDDDPSKTEASHYYKFLSLQSELTPYGSQQEVLPSSPTPPPAAATQWTPADLSKITYAYPKNPTTANYPAQVQALSNLCNAVYQYMFLMSEATYKVSGAAQEKLFNVDMHKAMIWILDRMIKGMREFTVAIPAGSPIMPLEQNVTLAPTFENLDITSNGLSPKSNVQAYIDAIQKSAAAESPAEAALPNSYTNQLTMLNSYNIPSLIADLSDISLPPGGFEIPAVALKHSCMGLNACNGQGRAYSGHEPNSCAGEGLCATATDHTCHTLNDCKQQGGCGLYGTSAQQSQPGGNECRGQGSCASPINAERFATADGVRGQSVWQLARKVFEARMKAEGKTFNDPPAEAYQTVNGTKLAVGPSYQWLSDNDPNFAACGASGMSGGGSCS
ncbi:MAG: ferritin-like protein [Sulfuricellaceae bacterium]|nr:ferritin-like protein [Sulfuricellaceae bacterium]